MAEFTSFTDPRDGHVYKTIKIGNQVWMAENMAYKTSKHSYVYDNDEDHLADFGRLYTFESAKEAAPEGWHVPSKAEWEELAAAIGGDLAGGNKILNIGTKLKSPRTWNFNIGTALGTDDYGFGAVAAGICRFHGDFFFAGYEANFWTSTEAEGDDAYNFGVYYNYNTLYCHSDHKAHAFSLRLVKDSD